MPINHITSRQLKPAGLVNGFIQFSSASGVEKQSRLGRQSNDAARDENAVMFTKKHQSAFEELRAAIERAMTAGAPKASGTETVAQLQQPVGAVNSVVRP
jgi:hypothetical protein